MSPIDPKAGYPTAHPRGRPTKLEFGPDSEPPGARECPICGSRFHEGARFCPYDGEALQFTEESRSDPLVGTLIDSRYQVERVLGEGGMGTVYCVTHQVLDRQFALKALRGDLSREGDLGERFLREARSAAAIEHPSCCKITDFGYLPDRRPYFCMELLTGNPLNWWLAKGGPIPVAPGVRIIQQIAGVLDVAHQAGIVHRDLKPENVIVEDATTGERVKVVDFGLAQVAGSSRLTRPGVVYGTPHYMSPEQAMGGQVDHRADIYALGIVMYEMFTGRVPFEADTYMGVLTKHMYVEPTPPSAHITNTKLLGALEDVILRCLQKRPERRYQRAADLSAELAAILRPTEDGSFQVAPRKQTGQRASQDLPQLADDVELPTAAEMQRVLRRFESAPLGLSRRRMLALGTGVLGAVGVLAYQATRIEAPHEHASGAPGLAKSDSTSAAGTSPTAGAAPGDKSPYSVERPLVGGQPGSSPVDPAASSEAPSTANPASATSAARSASKSKARRPSASKRPSKRPTQRPKSSELVAEEIVDPWPN